jgi:hypothetical protein
MLLLSALQLRSLVTSCTAARSVALHPLLETFQESDLIGMWQTQYGAGASTDTLTIREDGTYKQVYACDVCYEGEGRFFEKTGQWWLEERSNGGLYLHLEGMRRCDNTDEVCEWESGGGGDYPYWNYCEGRVEHMPGEVILMVTGMPPGLGPAPRGVLLRHMATSRESAVASFALQEE